MLRACLLLCLLALPAGAQSNRPAPAPPAVAPTTPGEPLLLWCDYRLELLAFRAPILGDAAERRVEFRAQLRNPTAFPVTLRLTSTNRRLEMIGGPARFEPGTTREITFARQWLEHPSLRRVPVGQDEALNSLTADCGPVPRGPAPTPAPAR